MAEVRSRASVLLAAAAVVPSLLTKAIFHGPYPHGFVEISAVCVGLAGAAGVLVFVLLLLRRRSAVSNARSASRSPRS